MTKFIRLACIIIFFGLIGCASTPSCPDAALEPVSTCRAETKCGGIATSAFWILGAVRANYYACVDRELAAQKSNAKVPDRVVSCSKAENGVEKCELHK